MINVPMKTCGPLNSQTVLSINQKNIQSAHTSQTIGSINNGKATSVSPTVPVAAAASVVPAVSTAPVNSTAPTVPAASPAPAARAATTASTAPVTRRPIPNLLKPVQKGQKVPLETAGKLTKIKACFGWNVTNPACDVDVSAFLLNGSGKVLGDTWFVFYGQEASPDGSTLFSADNGTDRELISVDFTKLNPSVSKIVFVLTINEALEKHLNFSMLNEAYVRILNCADNNELASFKMNEYYSNVASMMIGEIYQHNGAWKFNAVGNGVERDLAGLCELYGVQVD